MGSRFFLCITSHNVNLRKIVPLERHGMRIMSFGFISGNQAPTLWRGPLVAKMTEQFFEDVDWGELDFLILDLPPGTGDVQLTMIQRLALTGAVIVTTPPRSWPFWICVRGRTCSAK